MIHQMQATISSRTLICRYLRSIMSFFPISLKGFSMAFLLQAVLAYPSVPIFERQTTAVPDYVTKFGME